MATQEERKKATRMTIINHARTLFEKQGYEETSLGQILDAANIVKGTFYKHFNNKLDVLIAANKEERRAQAREALNSLNEDTDALEVLKQYLHTVGTWLESKGKMAHAIILTQLTQPNCDASQLDPETSGRSFTRHVLLTAQQQGAIRDDLDAQLMAEMLGGLIVVAVLRWSQHPEPGALVAALEKTCLLFLDGAKQEKYA